MSESIWDDPRITAYVLGELSEQECSEFESELQSNAELTAAVDEARRVTGQLENLYAAEPGETLDDDRRAAIVPGQTQTTSVAPAAGSSWRMPVIVMATAATLLLLVGLAPWIMQRKQEIAARELGRDARSIEPAEIESLREAVVEEGTEEYAADAMFAHPGQEHPDQTVAFEAETGDYVKESLAAGATVTSELTVLKSGASMSRSSRGSEPQDSDAKDAPATATSSQPLEVALGVDPTAERSSDMSSLPVSGAAPAKPGQAVIRGRMQNLDALPSAALPDEYSEQRPAEVELEQARPQLSKAIVPVAPQSGTRRELQLQYRSAAVPTAPMEKQLDSAKSESKEAAGKMFDDGLLPNASPAPAPFDSFGRGAADGAIANPVNGRQVRPEAITRSENMRRGGMEMGMGGMGGALGGADFMLPIDEGRGPGIAGDRFDPITDNPFKRVAEHPLSTFSVDVDTASYSKTRDFLMRANQLPRPDAVRIEEFLNYFDYEYQPPSADDKHPFAARAIVTGCPWNQDHRLARIALKGKTMEKKDRPLCNLVFLLDTSGSMNAPNKLPLVIEGMQMLLGQLDEEDKVAITVYAGSAGLILDSTPAKKGKKIRKALTELAAGGSTNGGAGIALAYQTARDNFVSEGVNRVILCTDGDFNVGTTGTDELVRMVEREAKGGIFLSVLGFGMGNHNDAMLEQISGRGNGNYAFIDTQSEARKVLVNQTSGTLVTIAKDVKLQIEFNPKQVSAYRLIGYENRVLAKEDFNDDKKDAGEIGAGHAVTALYEIVPAGLEADAIRPEVDPLKYQTELKATEAAGSGEMMTLKLRYKEPDSDTSTLVEFPVADEDGAFEQADNDVRFAAAVAGFGMQLRRSEYRGTWTLSDVITVADGAKGKDRDGLRAEFVELARKASELMGQE